MRPFLRRPAVWVVGASIVLAVVAVAIRARGPAVSTVAVVRRDIEQHVVASGRVLAPARVNVSALSPGLVVAVGAIEGQHVAAGDLLVQVDDAEARASIAQARAAVEQARARVEQLQRVGAIVATQGLSQAQTNLDKAQGELDRATALAATGAIASVELDNARHAVELARAQKYAAEAQQLASTPLGADSRVALGALLQAQAQLTGANVRLAQTRLVAASAGVVLSRSVEPGDVVQPGRTLLLIAVDGDVQLVFSPDERNLANMALGGKARAAADAFPQDVFDAEVSYVAPSIDPQRGTVEVRLRVPSPPKFLRPDMTVSIDLLVTSKPAVLSAPADAVRGLATPTPWLLVASGGVAVRKDVKLGIRGEGAVEIVSGVDEGALAILPSGVAIEPGQRVRPTRKEP